MQKAVGREGGMGDDGGFWSARGRDPDRSAGKVQACLLTC
jgi:hypothetical protein